MENPPEAPELLAGRISATERLNQGSNKIKIEALDVKGAKFEKEWSCNIIRRTGSR